MTTPDPWVVLGLPPGSSLADARAARRRLAKQLHPDLHPERATRMTVVNRALAEIEGSWGKEPTPTAAGPAEADRPRPSKAAAFPRAAQQPAHPCGPHEPDSFSVEFLPAEAFEALFLAGYGLGDILVADEPYLLELYLSEPCPCFCRLTLVPEAGGSLVTAEIAPATDATAAPEPAAVVEVLVAEVNALAVG